MNAGEDMVHGGAVVNGFDNQVQALFEETKTDTLDRSLKRIGLVVDMLYDDEEDDAGSALADIVTDLAHEAERRGVDIQNVFSRGLWMYEQEREEWSQ